MNRRSFLSVLGTVAATATLDPEPIVRKTVLLEFQGQTVFPVYGMDGGLAKSAGYYLGYYENGIPVTAEMRKCNPDRFDFPSDLNLPTEPFSKKFTDMLCL